MKRFLVFKGRQYYPCGGMDDFLTDVDSLEDGVKAIEKSYSDEWNEYCGDKAEWIEYEKSYGWANIYDTLKRVEVYNQAN